MAPLRGGPHTDPAGREKSGGVGWGGLLVAAFGLLFVGYIFNAGGLQTAMDGMFAGWNSSAHTHDAQVQRVFLAVLPAFAGMLVLALLWVLLFAGGSGGGHKRKQTRRKRKHSAEVHALQEAKVESVEAVTFIRPVRLAAMAGRAAPGETKRPG